MMTGTVDPAGAAMEEMAAKVLVYGTAVVGLVILALGIYLGVRWLGHLNPLSFTGSPRGGSHHSSRPSIGKAWR